MDGRVRRNVRLRVAACLGVCLVQLPLAAQTPQAARPEPAPRPRQVAALGVEQSTILTNGWAFVAQGDVTKAAEKANQLSSVNPRHPAVFALVLEVEILRAGALASAEAYHRWMGSRTVEEPAFLRRVAVATLEEAAAQPQDPSARLDALSALSNGGDIRARARLTEAVRRGDIAETRLLAARGDEVAVKQLSQALGRTLPNPVTTIQALGESGSRLAVPALTARLSDPLPEVRGAAAEALARTGGPTAIPRLRQLMSDPSSHVRVKAASGLYRLDDTTGLGLLREMAAADSAPVRLAAAEAMASKPDAAWEGLVRGLTQAGEPDVRLTAARLAARFDPTLAEGTLRTLSRDTNLAIGHEASRLLAAEVPVALGALRDLLRHPDRLTRVAAAAAVLKQTN
jgi:HEAT repeat protein